ncbi:hypothetical protein Mapa_017158 [Marchantia paleacea]|nr:hypothetical protein Mapa_017158 [Marchantia paleacea]
MPSSPSKPEFSFCKRSKVWLAPARSELLQRKTKQKQQNPSPTYTTYNTSFDLRNTIPL